MAANIKTNGSTFCGHLTLIAIVRKTPAIMSLLIQSHVTLLDEVTVYLTVRKINANHFIIKNDDGHVMCQFTLTLLHESSSDQHET